MSKVRPISLRLVVYKIVSKVLVHRLQKYMNRIINANQSAFLKGRLISDNILVAHECMHHLKNKRSGDSFEMALKLDMSKAYDCVEWSFPGFIMQELGFDDRWFGWVKACVTTVFYSIVVEGQPFGYFKSNRGLRQEDPLSLYLFLLCVEGLTFLLHQAELSRKIQGLKISSRCPSISHLLFADDSLLFSKALATHYANEMEVLNTYERFSDHKINLNKLAIIFSHNTPHRLRTQLARQMNISHIETQDKYLRLASIVQTSKKAIFAFIKEKVSKRLQSWKRSLMSPRGRNILIKAMGEAILFIRQPISSYQKLCLMNCIK